MYLRETGFLSDEDISKILKDIIILLMFQNVTGCASKCQEIVFLNFFIKKLKQSPICTAQNC